jgi:hypothetical protein
VENRCVCTEIVEHQNKSVMTDCDDQLKTAHGATLTPKIKTIDMAIQKSPKSLDVCTMTPARLAAALAISSAEAAIVPESVEANVSDQDVSRPPSPPMTPYAFAEPMSPRAESFQSSRSDSLKSRPSKRRPPPPPPLITASDGVDTAVRTRPQSAVLESILAKEITLRQRMTHSYDSTLWKRASSASLPSIQHVEDAAVVAVTPSIETAFPRWSVIPSPPPAIVGTEDGARPLPKRTESLSYLDVSHFHFPDPPSFPPQQ